MSAVGRGNSLDLHSPFRDSWGWERIGKDDLQGLIGIDGGRGDAFLSASGLEMGGVALVFEHCDGKAHYRSLLPRALRRTRWAARDIKDIAVQAGFKDVELLEVFPWRRAKAWKLRATREDDTSHMELNAGDFTLIASLRHRRVDRRRHESIAPKSAPSFLKGTVTSNRPRLLWTCSW